MTGNDTDPPYDPAQHPEFEAKLAELEAALAELPPLDPNRPPGSGGIIAALFGPAGTTRH